MHKKSYARQHQQAIDQRVRENTPMLPHLDIELTERCNNACRHCYINRPLRDLIAHQELSTDAWLDLLRQAADLGTLSVRMTGGEVLIRDDFPTLYQAARRLGMQVQVLTNARRITPELAELWARMPPRKPVEVTVYGMTPVSSETVTGCADAYAEAHNGIELLEARGIPYIVKTTVTPDNITDFAAFDTWTKSIPWMHEPATGTLHLDLRARRDSEARNRQIRDLRLAPAQAAAFLLQHRPAVRDELLAFLVAHADADERQLFDCGAGHTVCIDAYGQLLPCIMLRAPELTVDLRVNTLRDGMLAIQQRVAAAQPRDPDYHARCGHCFLRNLCEQCPAKSWIEHGTLDTPVDYYCAVTHALACALDILSPGEQAWEVSDGDARVQCVNAKQRGEQ